RTIYLGKRNKSYFAASLATGTAERRRTAALPLAHDAARAGHHVQGHPQTRGGAFPPRRCERQHYEEAVVVAAECRFASRRYYGAGSDRRDSPLAEAIDQRSDD